MEFAYKGIVVKESLQEYQKDIQNFSEIFRKVFLKCLRKKNGVCLQMDCSQREPSDEPDSLEEMIFLKMGLV